MVDLYHSIYDGEIFKQSQCIWHENALMDFFRSNLQALGYQSANDSNKVWQRGGRRVVVCLVDDFSTCSTEYSKSLPYLFDPNTVVITDNYTTVPTQYRVCQLPTSFFGIYQHTPSNATWNPQRRFNFSVNRLDTKRMLLMLELWSRCRYNPDLNTLDFINFNCWSWDGNNNDSSGLKSNFERQWNLLDSHHQEVYAETYQDLLSRMPMRNHNLTHEQGHVSAWVNVVMETYSSDSAVALSEKTFRALCLPVPWILYCGKHSVAYLHQLGFDVMLDVMEHRYDGMIENKTAAYGDKMVDFIFEGTDFVDRSAGNFERLQQRCVAAALRNQQHLRNLARQWPHDFAQWWPQLVQSIS